MSGPNLLLAVATDVAAMALPDKKSRWSHESIIPTMERGKEGKG